MTLRRFTLLSLCLLALAGPSQAEEPVSAAQEYAQSRLLKLRQGWQRSQGYGADYELIQAALQGMREALQQGDIDEAKNILERAASTVHAVEIEIGMIQTLMQAGEYQHALSAAAHTQAEHRDHVPATQLYARLLTVGGHRLEATRLLDAARQAGLDVDGSRGPVTLPTSASPAAPCAAVASGWLIDSGKRVLSVLPGVEPGQRLVVRTSSGQLVNAALERSLPEHQLAVLMLQRAIPMSRTMPFADKPPVVGNPVYLVGYAAPGACDMADWPLLTTDVLGMPAPDAPVNYYKIHSKVLSIGGGIINKNGALMGFARRGSDNTLALLPLATLQSLGLLPERPPSTAAPLPADEIYETGLASAVQILLYLAD